MTLEVFSEEIFKVPLQDICTALAPSSRGGLAALGASIGSSEYRRARKSVKKLLRQRQDRKQTLSGAQGALDQMELWGRLCEGQSWPALPANLDAVSQTVGQLLLELDHLSKYVPEHSLRDSPLVQLDPLLSRLLADQPTLAKLPEVFRLEQSLVAAGLGELVVELKNRQLSSDLCRLALRHVWLSSILERVRLEDPMIGTFDGNQINQTIAEYQQLDVRHIKTTPDRVRRGWAERVFDARSRLKDEESLIRKQAGLKRRLMPFRSLVTSSLNLLLELKPCWAMSPLVVSQVLPAKRLFDVVIFDEASQVRPADAVPAIARGERVVLAGDKQQLPPSAFFLSSGEEEEEMEEEVPPELAATSGFESILENLDMLVPFRMLTWHYRSHDERLIAFSNANFYDHGLTTFPGAVDFEPVKHVAVPFAPGRVGKEESVSAEVDRVVRLILTHARDTPDETLGVIAMGIKHANRIEEELRRRLGEEEDLDEFFAETNEERFFVKNLERVQGDERDAIILSVGYGKSPEGKMLYRFGPINVEGGQRRLNVAVTRARRRMTTVSSFSCDDMDPDRLRAEGARILRAYLRYAESGATNFGEHAMVKPVLNAFEVDVRDTLSRHGVPVTAQLGVSGYWIDFAAKHPTREGKYVLAIECDGATYHSSETARDRDRLRQEQLQRLGWRFHRIWSTDWFSNKEAAVEGVLEAYKRAVEQSDSALTNYRPPSTELPSRTSPSRSARPPVRRGRKIDEYTQHQLVSLVHWIDSDTLLRTDEEVLREVMDELGFKRRGTKIVDEISRAVRTARRGR
jgi:very-short-patch-repair endonuclease